MFLKYHISFFSEKEAICSLPFLSTFLLTEKKFIVYNNNHRQLSFSAFVS